MQKQARFLSVLWSFVLCSFLLFQNFTQNVTPTVLHNDTCKQSLDLNEARILKVNGLHADLLAIWPKGAQNLNDPLNNLTLALMEANKQIYQLCLTEGVVRDSHLLALTELNKLSNPDANKLWKNYIKTIETALQKVAEASR